MTWGHELKVLLEIQKSMGVTPRALLDRPKLTWFEDYCFDFYRTLSRSRQYHQIPQPIQISEVSALLVLHGTYSYSERLWLLSLVQELDLAFIDHHVSKKGTKPGHSEEEKPKD